MSAGNKYTMQTDSYLPVDRRILHQLFKFLLHCSLENTGLISLFSKLTSESSLSRTELQKHNKVWFWQTYVRFLAPVQTETLGMTEHVTLLVAPVKMCTIWQMQSLKGWEMTHRLGTGEGNSRKGVPVYNQSGTLLQLLLHQRSVC